MSDVCRLEASLLLWLKRALGEDVIRANSTKELLPAWKDSRLLVLLVENLCEGKILGVMPCSRTVQSRKNNVRKVMQVLRQEKNLPKT